jgi:dihydroorotate dehydrogenase
MYPELKLQDLLKEMRSRSGSAPRLAQMLKVTDRTVWDWLKKSEENLHRLHQENIEQIVRAARELRIEPELFAPALPLWDFECSYDANLALDPGMPPVLAKPFRDHRVSFLGRSLRSPFGASASVMTCNSARVRFLAHAGVDVIFYKTVRSVPHRAHPSPNIFCCGQGTGVLDPAQRTLPTVIVGNPAEDLKTYKPSFGMMNRFGMPSQPPEVWKADFRAAREFMAAGQLLILSVVGTVDPADSSSALLADIVRVVELAMEAGAEVIEINLSCPNCSGMEGELYHNLPLVLEICKSVSKVAGRTQIILKIGYMKPKKLREFVVATAPYVSGFSAINTLPVEGLRQGQRDTEPAFGTPGLKAGLSGKPIHRYALDCVQSLVAIRESEALKQIAIIGIGGVTEPGDVLNFLKSGADLALATTAFFDDPYFGIRVRRVLDSELSKGEFSVEDEKQAARINWSQAIGTLEQELGGSEAVARTIRENALADIFEWEREHAASVSLGPRRSLAVTTPEEFARRIRARLGKRGH